MANIINGLGQIKVGVKPTPPPTPLLLNTYSGATVAYSLRKINMNYSGAAIRVRRSSDNTSQDIGFDVNGGLDTVALLSFCGAGSGYVSIWYDQTGNGRYVDQTTAANQPTIVYNGSVITQNGKPAIYFWSGGGQFLRNNYRYNISGESWSVVWVAGLPNGFDSNNVYNYWGGSQDYEARVAAWQTLYYMNSYASSNLYSTVNTTSGMKLLSVIYANQDKLRLNGSTIITPTIAWNPNTILTNWAIGRSNWYNQPFEGYYQEFIIYPSDLTSTISTIESSVNSYYSIYQVVSDSDAQAFINAAVITDSTQANAINTLVTDLKTAGIWSKMKAIYPFVGGTASSHKYNLKDPRDLDAAYRLVFAGGGTHSSNGYQLNGSNSYGDTKFIPSTSFISSSRSSFGVYSRTNPSPILDNRVVMGSISEPGWVFLYLKGGVNQFAVNNSKWGSFAGPTSTYVNKLGFYQSSRDNSSTTQLWQVNNNNYSGTSTATGLSTTPIYIGSSSGADVGQFTDNVQLAYAYIGDDLSTTDLSNYYTAVQKYQTTLGRQV